MDQASTDTFLYARIVHRREIAPGLWSIRVDAGGAIHFTAGQYATLGVLTPERSVERAYSIVSSPYERELEFFLELLPDGELTPLLHRLNPGDSIGVRKTPKGRMTLDVASGRRHHLLLCTVTGVAPFISYARTLRDDWKAGRFKGEHQLYVIQGASHSRELGYREELDRMAREVPWLKYVPTISRPSSDPGWRGETGRVEDVLRKYTDHWSLAGRATTAYLCGHPDMIERGMAILQRQGWEKDALKEETYFSRQAVHG